MSKPCSIGDKLGDYRIDGFLGAGGMGEVYSASHEKLGRRAAVKVLGSAAITDPVFKARFLNEARLQANLSHPNIAALYDFQEDAGQLYIFMEYVDGETLEDMIAKQLIQPERALRIISEVAEAIAYMHRNGIVHRDIKSQNVKVTSSGGVKLLDFGIAKDSSNDHGLTQTGGVIGTPHYLAPEQLDGKPASASSDIWALGILLFEMLTGEMPFKSETLGSLVLKIVSSQVEFPPEFELPEYRPAAAIIARCLQKSPADRYDSVDSLLADINLSHDGEKSFEGESFEDRSKSSADSFNREETAFECGELVERSSGNNNALLYAVGGVGTIILIIAFGILVIYFSANSGGNDFAFANRAQPFAANTEPNNTRVKKIKVDVDEGRADVVRDLKTVGQTPFEFEANEGAKVALTLRREGFEDKPVEIEIKGGKRVYTFSLKAKAGK